MDIYNSFHKLKEKKISSVDLVKVSIDKIKKYDTQYNFMLENNFDKALKEAEQIDNERMKGINTNYLTGIPYTCKDNIMTNGITTTCGSRILENFMPPFSATIINEISKNRGILLGKVNLDELGAGGESLSGFMKTKNPYNTNESVSGSSGGSAVCVSLGIGSYSLGSDTGGSVREPAEKCGVIGFKPTYGSISRYGVGAYAHSLDQIGFITNSVIDACVLLETLGKKDKKDVITYTRDYTGLVENVINYKVDKIKIGIVKEIDILLNKEELQYYVECVENFKKNKNIEVVEISIPNIIRTDKVYKIITSVEGYSNFNKYDGAVYGKKIDGDNYKQSAYETRKAGFGEKVKAKIIMGDYLLSKDGNKDLINIAYKIKDSLEIEVNNCFKDVDTIVLPMESFHKNFYLTSLSNLAKTPSIELPVKINNKNVPQGIQLIGKKFEDIKLLQISTFLEKLINFKGGLINE